MGFRVPRGIDALIDYHEVIRADTRADLAQVLANVVEDALETLFVPQLP